MPSLQGISFIAPWTSAPRLPQTEVPLHISSSPKKSWQTFEKNFMHASNANNTLQFIRKEPTPEKTQMSFHISSSHSKLRGKNVSNQSRFSTLVRNNLTQWLTLHGTKTIQTSGLRVCARAYMIFVLFALLTQFLAQFSSTQKCVNCGKKS